MLRAVLEERGVSQRRAAALFGLSPAAVNLIVNKGQWPRKGAEAARRKVASALASLGVPPALAMAVVTATASAAAWSPMKKR